MNLKPYQFSKINPLRFSPEEITLRKTWHCLKHRHSGLQHPNCYNEAHNIQERVGCLDIESGGLDAGFDIVYCVSPETLVLTSDLRWVKAEMLKAGDTLIGINEYPDQHKRGEKRRLLKSTIMNITVINQPRLQIYTDLGNIVVSENHKFLYYSSHTGGYVWQEANKLKEGEQIRYCVTPWVTPHKCSCNQWDDGWLAGIADGDGSLSFPSRNRRSGGQLGISQSTKYGFDKVIESKLQTNGYEYYIGMSHKSECKYFYLTGKHILRFLGQARPIRLLNKFNEILEQEKIGLPQNPTYAKITKIEPIGMGPVVAIETSAKTLITNGFVSHNCWFIKTSGKNKILYDCITLNDLKKGCGDKRILENLSKTLWNYDRIVTHYGSNYRFDIPFVRTRCIRQGIDFPTHGMLWLSDTYQMARRLLCLKSNRQGRVAGAILGKDIKTKMGDNYWLAVKYGNDKEKKAALEYIRKHCETDVTQLDANYLAMKPFIREIKSSI